MDRREPPLVPGTVPLDVVQANRFELVDAHGVLRGGLGFNDKGHPTFMLTDARRDTLVIRAELRLTEEGPALVLADARGTHRVTLVLKEGVGVGPALLINDAGHKPRIVIGLDDERNGAHLAVFDRRGVALTVPAYPKPTKGTDAVARNDKPAFARMLLEHGILDTKIINDVWRDRHTILARRRAKKRRLGNRRTTKPGGAA